MASDGVAGRNVIGRELVIAVRGDEDLLARDEIANTAQGIAHSAASRRSVSPGTTRVKCTGSVVIATPPSASRATV